MKVGRGNGRRTTARWVYVAMWIVLITILSSRSFGFATTLRVATQLFSASAATAESPVVITAMMILRKVAHLSEYAALTFFAWTAFARSMPRGVGQSARAFNVLIVCLLTALADEFHQTYVPGRTGQWSDVGVDLLGCIGFLIWVIHRTERTSAQKIF